MKYVLDILVLVNVRNFLGNQIEISSALPQEIPRLSLWVFQLKKHAAFYIKTRNSYGVQERHSLK